MALYESMLNRCALGLLLVTLFLPSPLWAVEVAPALTDREIADRLTRLEEGQQALRTEVGQLREDMNRQNQHLRDDINAQFDRLFQLLLGLLGTFTALVIATIGFALWDRRSMLRPIVRPGYNSGRGPRHQSPPYASPAGILA